MKSSSSRLIRLISPSIISYRRNRVWTIIVWFLIFITGGLLRLVFHWVPHLMLQITHSKCSLEEAETVLLIERFQGKHTSYYVKKLRILTAREVMSVIFFIFIRFNINRIVMITVVILSCRNKSFNEESLIDEAWDGNTITIKEEKKTYPMLSVHLCGGQFKRKWIISMSII